MDDNECYWITDLDPDVPEHKAARGTFGDDTVGIVDTSQGGIVAYVHSTNAQRILAALIEWDYGR